MSPDTEISEALFDKSTTPPLICPPRFLVTNQAHNYFFSPQYIVWLVETELLNTAYPE
jgi:hypothetical protein